MLERMLVSPEASVAGLVTTAIVEQGTTRGGIASVFMALARVRDSISVFTPKALTIESS
ncbi:MAG TPA: hypothetical protein VGJ48_06315 [Pyrinomonadaceae bacterium]